MCHHLSIDMSINPLLSHRYSMNRPVVPSNPSFNHQEKPIEFFIKPYRDIMHVFIYEVERIWDFLYFNPYSIYSRMTINLSYKQL